MNNINAQRTHQLEDKPAGLNHRAPLGEVIKSIVIELKDTVSAWEAVDDPWNDESAGERDTLKIAVTCLQWILLLLEESPGLPWGLANLKVTALGGAQGGHDGLNSSARTLQAIADDIAPIACALSVYLKHIAQDIQRLLTDMEAHRQ